MSLSAALVSRGVPEHLHAGLIRYFEHRVRPGGFLCAVLANDLALSHRTGDPEAVAGLPALVGLLVNDVPAVAWGSTQRVAEWLRGAA